MSPVIGVIIAIILILAAGTYFAVSTAAAKKAEQDAIIAQQKLEESQKALLAAQQQQQAAAAAALEAQQKLDAQKAAEQKLAEQQAADAAAAAAAAAAQQAATPKPAPVNPYAIPYSCAYQKDGMLYLPTFTGGNDRINRYQASPNADTCNGLNGQCSSGPCPVYTGDFIWQNQTPPGARLPADANTQNLMATRTTDACVIC